MLSSASCGMAATGATLSKVRPWPACGSIAVLGGKRGAVGDPLQLLGLLLALGVGEAAGVELDHRRAEAQRGLDLPLGGLDEQADADAGRRQAVDVIGELVVLAGGVEPALGGPLLALFRDDAGGVGRWASAISSISSVAAISRFSGRSISAISRSMSLVGDVAPVLAQMGGDAVGAGGGGDLRGADRVGMVAAARVADGRDMVDVDAEAEPGAHHAAARLPGLTAGIAASSGGSASAS